MSAQPAPGPPNAVSVLLVEDEPAHTAAISRSLEAAGGRLEVRSCSTLREYRQVVAARQPDLVLLDQFLPDGQAVDVLAVDASSRSFPVVVMTSHGNEQTAVAASRRNRPARSTTWSSPRRRLPTCRTWSSALSGSRRLRQEGVRAAEELRATAERLQLALDAAELGTWRYDVATDEIVFGEHACAHFGLDTRGPCPIATVLALVHPEDLDRVREEIADSLVPHRNAERFTHEYRIVRRDGDVRWLSVQVSVHFEGEGADRRATFTIGTTQDVTERKRAEEYSIDIERRLLHAQKVESLAVLAGGVAHDFNNLLMAIMGNLDLAEAELPATSSVRVRVERAIQATRRASELSRLMLAYSGRGAFAVARLDLGEVVRQSVECYRASLPATISLALPRRSGQGGDRTVTRARSSRSSPTSSATRARPSPLGRGPL